ncbi:alpha-1,2-fucosyltransferase [Bacteroides fragilis]
MQDMYLMSLCNHHIISNSSFYWWGAYLASTNNHIVIAPSVFLNKDCTPIDWVII